MDECKTEAWLYDQRGEQAASQAPILPDEAEEANASSESSTEESSTGSEAVTDEGSGTFQMHTQRKDLI